MDNETSEIGYRIELFGDLDRQTAEMIHLEIRWLAKRYDVTVKELQVENAQEEPSA